MWTALKYVTSGITLLAFICALGVWLYRLKLLNKQRLIESAPEAKRAELVKRTLVLFDVDTAKLTRKQQYDLAITQIRERANKYRVTAVVVVIFGVLAAILTFVAIPRFIPSATVESLSGKIEKVEVVPDQGGANQIFILLSIENMGAPAAIPSYDIRINHVTTESFEYSDVLEKELQGQYTVPQAGGKGPLVINPQDSLISKTREAIGTGGKVSGWLRLVLPVDQKKLTQPGTRYTISFTDTIGNAHQTMYEMK